MNIVLCGMMGCGKSTVSYELAKMYSLERVETDKVIVDRYGEISKIFDRFGEKYFRDIETYVVKEIAKKYDNAVISLGGGCVLREENVQALKETGKIVYLRTSLETLLARVKGDTTRPLLKGDARQNMTRLLNERKSVYESVADVVVDTDNIMPKRIAAKIWELVK
jgi:shikimate kinase